MSSYFSVYDASRSVAVWDDPGWAFVLNHPAVHGALTHTYFFGRTQLRCSNWPPDDDGTFARLAADLGFGADLAAYVFEHEVCHLLVPRVLFGCRGYVSWMAANNRKMSLAAAKAEERLIWYAQAAASGLIKVPDGMESAVGEVSELRAALRALGHASPT